MATKKEMFELIATVNADNAEIVEFCNHQIELLNRKSSNGTKKPTKTQLENIQHKENIVKVLTESDKPLTVSEVLEDPRLVGLTNQKVSALMGQLKREGKIVRFEEKRKAYFDIPEAIREENFE